MVAWEGVQPLGKARRSKHAQTNKQKTNKQTKPIQEKLHPLFLCVLTKRNRWANNQLHLLLLEACLSQDKTKIETLPRRSEELLTDDSESGCIFTLLKLLSDQSKEEISRAAATVLVQTWQQDLDKSKHKNRRITKTHKTNQSKSSVFVLSTAADTQWISRTDWSSCDRFNCKVWNTSACWYCPCLLLNRSGHKKKTKQNKQKKEQGNKEQTWRLLRDIFVSKQKQMFFSLNNRCKKNTPFSFFFDDWTIFEFLHFCFLLANSFLGTRNILTLFWHVLINNQSCASLFVACCSFLFVCLSKMRNRKHSNVFVFFQVCIRMFWDFPKENEQYRNSINWWQTDSHVWWSSFWRACVCFWCQGFDWCHSQRNGRQLWEWFWGLRNSSSQNKKNCLFWLTVLRDKACASCHLFDWLNCWLIEWLIDCLIDWIVWLSDWMIVWLNDCLIEWLNDWMIVWLNDWMIEWSIDWLNDCLIDFEWLNDWLNDCWLIDWMIEWLFDWMIEWLIDWMIVWLNDWMIDWLNDWMIEWLFDWMIEWLFD